MKRWMMTTVLVLAMSLVLTPVALACVSSASFTVDCTAAYFSGIVAEGELVRLEVRLHVGPWANPGPMIQNDYIVIAAPGPFEQAVMWAENPNGRLHRVAVSASSDGGQTWTVIAHVEGELTCAEGCTPGGWKKPFLNEWVGYSPDDDYETVFGVDASFTKTLLGALQQGGGGEKALGRHAVAALLNAANPNVDYLYSEAEVIGMVQDAYASGDFEATKNLLKTENELGCTF